MSPGSAIGLGVAPAGMDVEAMPGHVRSSVGYHGDDGCLFLAAGTGLPYGPTWKTGDIIRLQLDLPSQTLRYSYNGRTLQSIPFGSRPGSFVSSFTPVYLSLGFSSRFSTYYNKTPEEVRIKVPVPAPGSPRKEGASPLPSTVRTKIQPDLSRIPAAKSVLKVMGMCGRACLWLRTPRGRQACLPVQLLGPRLRRHPGPDGTKPKSPTRTRTKATRQVLDLTRPRRRR